MSTTVWTRVTAPGFHRWPNATGPRSYLADRHRHLFHLTVHVPVAHDDRDVEFHDLQDLIRTWWGPGTRECGPASCEDLARELWTFLQNDCHLTPSRVEVSEDGESGAIVTEVS
ncbi:hypothetical protein [Amycolatopsis anabasis]|uniref:hypothetical protein n=1 Tax=Amycolatopsis anabasis TaxID=1840409 RepID=UPI00131BF7BA|nr:hypothetical protein [Amycolatopsis anabasis]